MGRAARRKRSHRTQSASMAIGSYLLPHERSLKGLLLAVLFTACMIYHAGSLAFGYVDALITSSALEKNGVQTSGKALAFYFNSRSRDRWVRYQFTATDQHNVERTFTREQHGTYDELRVVRQQADSLPIIYVPGDPQRSSIAYLNYSMTPMQRVLLPIGFCIELGVISLCGWAIANALKHRRSSKAARAQRPSST